MARILIVEDRPMDRKLLATVLRSGGHSVVDASDGEEALRLASELPPDLVISDILMPTADGYELVRRMREIPGLAETPVIFYTATYHEREARVLARQAGVSEILTKPSEPETILATVDGVLANGRSVPPPMVDRAAFDRAHLNLVSSTLAMTIHNFEATEHRMSAIVDLAHQIAAERNPDDLLKRVCMAAREVTLAQHAVLGLLSDDGLTVRSLIASGLDDRATSGLQPPLQTAPVLDTIIAQRRSLRMRNPAGHPEFIGLPNDHPEVFSFLGVPIASPTRVYGWIGLRNKLGAAEFTVHDEEVATTLATHAAVAYENASLYDELRRHASVLEHEVAERTAVAAENARLFQEARRANQMKDEFLATLSHELRTPLNAVLGWVHMLEKPAVAATRLGDGLIVIERNAKALARLIEDLLDVSQASLGRLQLKWQDVDLSVIVSAALDTIRGAADARNVRLHASIDPRACVVLGDPTRLQQVVWNLALNAVKFTPPGGDVRVELQHGDHEAILSVSDTGIGIPVNLLPRVFERFWQADSAPTREFSGLGIGLAIVKDLIDLHGGSVTVDCQGTNKGTTFIVRLPLREASNAPMVPGVLE